MRTPLLLAATAAATAIALAGPALAGTALASAAPASAATPAAVRHHVLTAGKAGGPNVAARAVLQAGLQSARTPLRFSIGTIAFTCKQSTLKATVRVNPARPGAATASPKLTVGGCTVNVKGVRLTATFTASRIYVSDAKNFPVTLAAPVLTFDLHPYPFLCRYAAAKITGRASNRGSSITFTRARLTATNPATRCPLAGTGSVSAVYGPLTDTSVRGHPHVFVN
jgi:hypothetical protein